MTTKAQQNRLAAIERKSKARELLPEPVPFFSEAHCCYLENLGGIIVPCAVSVDEWAAAAAEQQDRLTTAADPFPAARAVRHSLKPPVTGAGAGQVFVCRRDDGSVSLRASVDAK